MALPTPTEKQGRIFWYSLTALAIGVLVALVGMLLLAFGWILQQLSSVLLPLAIAGIIAYLLDPVVDYLERRRIPRPWAIIVVFLIGVLVVALMLATVLPRVIRETQALVRQLPQYGEVISQKVTTLMKDPPLGIQVPEFLQFWGRDTNQADLSDETNRLLIETNGLNGATVTDEAAPPLTALDPNYTNEFALVPEPGAAGTNRLGPVESEFRWLIFDKELTDRILNWTTTALPAVGRWFLKQFEKVASWAGLLIGFALIPVYTFYFLAEKKGISRKWTDYLPIHESRIKEELVFVLTSINDYLILFFRGQVLVALCDGILLTIGFFAIGLNYAFLLGMVAGFLSIVPYLGVMISLVPALILAAVQFGDWLHPALVLIIFGLVQLAEGLVISPKIMGDRVGLHPLTIIIAVMVGTTLMGGIIGGILAIPLTAALRVLMFRYIWKRRDLAQPQQKSRAPAVTAG